MHSSVLVNLNIPVGFQFHWCMSARSSTRVLGRSHRHLHEDLLTTVKRWKLNWYSHVSRSPSLAKTVLQGTVRGARRMGRQKERWVDTNWTFQSLIQGLWKTDRDEGSWLWHHQWCPYDILGHGTCQMELTSLACGLALTLTCWWLRPKTLLLDLADIHQWNWKPTGIFRLTNTEECILWERKGPLLLQSESQQYNNNNNEEL